MVFTYISFTNLNAFRTMKRKNPCLLHVSMNLNFLNLLLRQSILLGSFRQAEKATNYVGNDRNLKLGNKGIQTYKCKCWIEEVLTYNVLHYSKKTEQLISTSWKINKILAFL